MTRRSFDPIQTFGARIEIETLHRRWQTAEHDLALLVSRRIDAGMRAQDAADMLGWSRATLFRWLARHRD